MMISGTRYNMESIQNALREGIVHFFYEKTNGERREAFGTLNADIIADRYAPAGKKPASYHRHHSDDAVAYFDLESGQYGEWRSFKMSNLLEVEDDENGYFCH